MILYSSISVASLARLLEITLSDIKDTLADLHTIFNIPDEPSHPSVCITLRFAILSLIKSDATILTSGWMRSKHTRL